MRVAVSLARARVLSRCFHALYLSLDASDERDSFDTKHPKKRPRLSFRILGGIILEMSAALVVGADDAAYLARRAKRLVCELEESVRVASEVVVNNHANARL